MNERISSRQQLRDWLNYEKARYGNISTLKYLLQTGEAAVLWKHQVLLRKTEYYINTHNKIMAALTRMRLQRFQHRYSIHIPPNVCGKGLKLMHIGPVLMNGNAVVGENCSFHINTAIVAAGSSNDVPQLGNNIVVGVGAVILGGIRIADSVAIGANAVVNKDVTEEDIAVAGVPAKKVSNNGRSSWRKQNNTAQ